MWDFHHFWPVEVRTVYHSCSGDDVQRASSTGCIHRVFSQCQGRVFKKCSRRNVQNQNCGQQPFSHRWICYAAARKMGKLKSERYLVRFWVLAWKTVFVFAKLTMSIINVTAWLSSVSRKGSCKLVVGEISWWQFIQIKKLITRLWQNANSGLLRVCSQPSATLFPPDTNWCVDVNVNMVQIYSEIIYRVQVFLASKTQGYGWDGWTRWDKSLLLVWNEASWNHCQRKQKYNQSNSECLFDCLLSNPNPSVVSVRVDRFFCVSFWPWIRVESRWFRQCFPQDFMNG